MIDEKENAMSYLSTSYDEALREIDLLRCERDYLRERLDQLLQYPDDPDEREQSLAALNAT